MKKYSIVLLLALVLFSLASCSDDMQFPKFSKEHLETMFIQRTELENQQNELKDLTYDYSVAYKTKVNGEYDIDRVEINDPEGIDYLWRNLKGTEVSFKKITPPPDLTDGEVWYEITDMQHIKSIQITNSGEVYTMAFQVPQLNIVYSISDEETKELFERIDQIKEIYGEE